jgi:hypothetical protein
LTEENSNNQNNENGNDKENNNENVTTKRLRVFVRPQNVCDYFIATMDPKDPLKICLYPSIKKAGNGKDQKYMNYNSRNKTGVSKLDQTDELENLVLHNYLTFKKRYLNHY